MDVKNRTVSGDLRSDLQNISGTKMEMTFWVGALSCEVVRNFQEPQEDIIETGRKGVRNRDRE